MEALVFNYGGMVGNREKYVMVVFTDSENNEAIGQ